MRRERAVTAFTLVELLVVIGIIAVLVSVLLPTLSRARGQANLVYCEANLHTIGDLLQIYAAANNGYAPAAWSYEYYSTFADTLTLTVNPKRFNTLNTGSLLNAYEPDQVLPVFHDTDVPPEGWTPRACAYIANVRALGAEDQSNANGFLWDPVVGNTGSPAGLGYPMRKLSSIQRSSEVMIIWCGAVNINTGQDWGVYHSYTDSLDNYQATNGHGFCFPTPAPNSQTPFNPANYNNPIALGAALSGGNQSSSNSGSVTPSYLKLANADYTNNGGGYNSFGGFAVNQMRFRHVNDTKCNFLFADGHTASRLIGSVVAQDICLNPKE
jgi:prepilin-type processing-associated H-X9-DG protein